MWDCVPDGLAGALAGAFGRAARVEFGAMPAPRCVVGWLAGWYGCLCGSFGVALLVPRASRLSLAWAGGLARLQLSMRLLPGKAAGLAWWLAGLACVDGC